MFFLLSKLNIPHHWSWVSPPGASTYSFSNPDLKARGGERRGAALPEEHKRAFGMHPEGIRLSLGLEDRHDIIRDLELALEKV